MEDTQFPRQESERYIFSIGGTSGLGSAKRDVYAYLSRFSKLGFKPYMCIDSDRDAMYVEQMLSKEQIQVSRVESISKLVEHIHQLAKKENPVDICITISAHGYGGKGNNYFHFKGRMVSAPMIREWYRPFETKGTLHRVITLIDTCHSGNMTNFQRIVPMVPEVELRNPIITISGCSPYQSLAEDISDEYGYGGGLTCAVMDCLKDVKGSFDLKTLAEYCYGRIIHLRAHVMVSQMKMV